MRANWIELSRSALVHNYRHIRRHTPAASRVCAVVKANAYGHGAVFCAQVLEQAGVEWFGVTSAEEGALLRSAGIRGRILVMGGFSPQDAPLLVEHALTPAVWDEQQLEWLRPVLLHHPADSPFSIHLKVDSGMGRLGLLASQEEPFCARLHHLPRLNVEAIYSHLSCSDSPDGEASQRQWQAFTQARRRLAALLPQPEPFWHLLNSSGILRYPEWSGGMVRAGLALYGYVLGSLEAPLRPVLAWKTRILSLKSLPAGSPIGYGERFRTSRPTRAAVLAVGYADGYSRALTGARVLLAGTSVPVIGNISMDLTTVDVTAIPEDRLRSPGMDGEVILLGSGGPENPSAPISAADLAAFAGTIPYELLCGISARVRRIPVD